MNALYLHANQLGRAFLACYAISLHISFAFSMYGSEGEYAKV